MLVSQTLTDLSSIEEKIHSCGASRSCYIHSLQSYVDESIDNRPTEIYNLWREFCLLKFGFSCSCFPHTHLRYSFIQGCISFLYHVNAGIYAYPIRSTLLPLWSAGWACHRRDTTCLNFWSNQMCSKLIWSLVLCESILFTWLLKRYKHKGNFCTRQNGIGLHILCTTGSLQVRLYMVSVVSLVGLCVLSKRPHSQKIIFMWIIDGYCTVDGLQMSKGSTSKDKCVIKRQLYSGRWEKYL